MGTLEDEAATRLARAIVQDIALYHAAVIQADGDLSEAIAEGRELYRSRAAERAYGAFEDALAERGLTRLERAGTAGSGPGTPARTPASPHDSFLKPLPARNGLQVPAPLVVVALVGVAGVALWLLTMR